MGEMEGDWRAEGEGVLFVALRFVYIFGWVRMGSCGELGVL